MCASRVTSRYQVARPSSQKKSQSLVGVEENVIQIATTAYKRSTYIRYDIRMTVSSNPTKMKKNNDIENVMVNARAESQGQYMAGI